MTKKLILTIPALLGCALALQGQITLRMPSTFHADAATTTGVAITATTVSFSIANSSGATQRMGGIGQLSQSTTLEKAGDFIQFAGTSGGQTSTTSHSYRVGFFNYNGLAIDADFDADMAGVTGVFGTVPYRLGGNNAGGVFSQGPGTATFMDINTNGTPRTTAGLGITSIGNTSAEAGHGVMTFRLKRMPNGDLTVTVTQATGGYSNMRTFAAASVPTYTFDAIAFGFEIGNNNSRSFSSIEITAVPEPSTYAALLGALALGLVAYRRRR